MAVVVERVRNEIELPKHGACVPTDLAVRGEPAREQGQRAGLRADLRAGHASIPVLQRAAVDELMTHSSPEWPVPGIADGETLLPMDGQGRGRAGNAGRIRVLWLIKGLGPGGAETLLVSMAQAADHTTFDYHVAFVRGDKRHLVPRLEAAGAKVHFVGAGRGGWPAGLRRLVRDLRPDVIHAHSPLLAVAARAMCRTKPAGRRPLMLSTEHNQWSSYAGPTRLANALTNRWDDRRWAVSQDVRESMWESQRDRVEVLVHGLGSAPPGTEPASRDEVRAELGLRPDDIVACTVANLRSQKDYPNLMSAAVAATTAEPSLRFIAVGQGPLESELSELHRSLDLGDRFRFLGYRDDVPAILSAADMFVLGSRHEGLPVALMEAMAAGLPTVATNVGGVPEAVTDGVEGLLVPPGRADDFAAAVLSLARDPARRIRMGAAARAGSADYDIGHAVSVVERAYRPGDLGAGAGTGLAFGDASSPHRGLACASPASGQVLADPAPATFAAVITTYNRPRDLEVMLRAVATQTRPPDILVVVDNASNDAVRRVVMDAGAEYVDAGTNSGPAGGFSMGVDVLLPRLIDFEPAWIVMLDDDDPPHSPHLFERLLTFACAQTQADPSTAAVGVRGARWDRARCRTRRIPDRMLRGPVSVDVIGNNQFPLYRALALSEVGAFDRSLFWGFEELDLGLRLRSAGYSLYVDGDVWREERSQASRVGLSEAAARRDVLASRQTAPWRTYYASRNRVVVSMRYAPRLAAARATIRAGFGGAVQARVRGGSPAEVLLPLRGAMDGLLGHMGRVVDPTR